MNVVYAVKSLETWVVVFLGTREECTKHAARLNLKWQTADYVVEVAA